MPKEPLLPSLLDRLAFDANGQGPYASVGGVSDDELQRTVLRDLSWLLNTTRLEATVPLDDFREVRSSVLNYGIDSLAGRTTSDLDEAELAGAIEHAIRTFEPRLRNVHVSATKKSDSARESVVLLIDAELFVRPLRDIHIRGVLDLDSSQVSLLRTNGAP